MSRNSSPAITDKYLKKAHREIKEGAVEGQIPPDNRTVTLAPGYVMNILGEITTEDERPLVLNKQKDGFPFLAIMDDSGKLEKIYVADAMRNAFGCYIDGFAETQFAPDDYTLAPKNGDRSDFMLSNLEFVKRHPQIVKPTAQGIIDLLHSVGSVYGNLNIPHGAPTTYFSSFQAGHNN